jgi:hypothetical protein
MDARTAFDRDGFVIVPRHVPETQLAPAIRELHGEFPTADEFHDNVSPERNERFRDEFNGITNFPFATVELSLLAVHDRIVDLAEALLQTRALRVYSIEAWAKYTGAAEYEQHHHRDYLGHTLLVPSRGAANQVEMFLYLNDVTLDLGPPSLVPAHIAPTFPAIPNWYPRAAGHRDDEHPAWVSPQGCPELYQHEVRADGPAGTVVAYRIETFHRGTEVTAPRGARYTIHVNFRAADCDWITRRAWTDTANTEAWDQFVARATPRQLELFGFPPPGHEFWTDEALEDLALRYPGIDIRSWRS